MIDDVSADDFGERAARRASWPSRVIRPGERDPEEDEPLATPEERLGMMWELVEQTWAIAGRSIPDYDRAHTPVVVIRRGRRG